MWLIMLATATLFGAWFIVQAQSFSPPSSPAPDNPTTLNSPGSLSGYVQKNDSAAQTLQGGLQVATDSSIQAGVYASLDPDASGNYISLVTGVGQASQPVPAVSNKRIGVYAFATGNTTDIGAWGIAQGSASSAAVSGKVSSAGSLAGYFLGPVSVTTDGLNQGDFLIGNQLTVKSTVVTYGDATTMFSVANKMTAVGKVGEGFYAASTTTDYGLLAQTSGNGMAGLYLQKSDRLPFLGTANFQVLKGEASGGGSSNGVGVYGLATSGNGIKIESAVDPTSMPLAQGQSNTYTSVYAKGNAYAALLKGDLEVASGKTLTIDDGAPGNGPGITLTEDLMKSLRCYWNNRGAYNVTVANKCADTSDP